MLENWICSYMNCNEESMYLIMQNKWNRALGAETKVNESVDSKNGLNGKYKVSEMNWTWKFCWSNANDIYVFVLNVWLSINCKWYLKGKLQKNRIGRNCCIVE